MNTSRERRLRILAKLDFRFAAAREVLSGILRYSASHPVWDLQICDSHPLNRPADNYLPWRPHGLIVDAPLDRRLVRRFKAEGLRGIATFHREDISALGLSSVTATLDQRAIAESAAALLLKKGLRNFAYVPAPQSDSEMDERQTAFVAYMARAGYATAVFDRKSGALSGNASWMDEIASLSQWLRHLPKPCGVLAAFDHRAKHVLDACRNFGIRVPEQIQVVGIDNETYLCEQTTPTLTSVMPDFEELGYRAAEQLNVALGDRSPRMRTILGGVKGIVERLSTSDYKGSARCVAQALEFIRRYAASGITVADVVRSAGTSERLLQRHFKSVCGKSVRDELIEVRLELIKRQLRTTRIPIDRVGDFCGFRDAKYLKTLFKRNFGLTMSDYRKSHLV